MMPATMGTTRLRIGVAVAGIIVLFLVRTLFKRHPKQQADEE